MKIKVEERFRDKFDHKTWYEVGTEIDNFDEERCQDLINKGWASLVEVAEDAIIDELEVNENETADVVADEVEVAENQNEIKKNSGKSKKKK
jgi:hypothetical protein